MTSAVLHRGYNSCQKSCDTNAIARQNDAPLPRPRGGMKIDQREVIAMGPEITSALNLWVCETPAYFTVS